MINLTATLIAISYIAGILTTVIASAVAVLCISKEESETAADNNDWIPCIERFPENDDYVLVSFENSDAVRLGWYEEDEEGGAFYPDNDTESCESYASYGRFVNAWQPLPKSYRQEGE